MAFKLNRNDYDLLTIIAEYRIVTLDQLAQLSKSNKQRIYRRIRSFEKEGLVNYF